MTSALLPVTTRLAALTAAAAVTLLLAVAAVWAADGEGPFPDVPADSPFADDITWMVERGITTGYADGTFRPTNQVSRQAFAAYLYRYVTDNAGGSCTTGTSSFPDVPDDSPFCTAIVWLSERGITTGYPDGSFRPTDPVSRQATAAFLFRLHHGGSNSTACSDGSPFSDVPASSAFCSAIAWLTTSGPPAIANGYDDGTFRPTTSTSRQATAAYLHRYDAAYAGKGSAGEPVPLGVTSDPLTQEAYPTLVSPAVVRVVNGNAFDVRITGVATALSSPETTCALALNAQEGAGAPALLAAPDAADLGVVAPDAEAVVDVVLTFTNDLPQVCESHPLSVSFTVTGSS